MKAALLLLVPLAACDTQQSILATAGNTESAVVGPPVTVAFAPTDTLRIAPIGAGGSLRGTTFDAADQPVPGVVLATFESSAHFAFAGNGRCTTGADGSCILPLTTTAEGVGKATLRISGGNSFRDTVQVKVTAGPPPPPPTLVAVRVTPVTAELSTGATQQFTASDSMSDGSIPPFSGTWTATGGTVSGSGLYEAGTVPGTYEVIATESEKADSSAVTVTDAPPPPPPSPPTADRGCPASGYLRLVTVSTNAQLSAALAAALPGDQIRVEAGTYASGHNWSKSGTEANPIVLCGVAGAAPVIRGVSFRSRGSYVRMLGLILDGNLGSENVVRLYGHHLVFSGNEIRNGRYRAGIFLRDHHHVTITYNYIHDNGVDSVIDHGIYFSRTTGPGNLIAHNLVVHNAGRGISIHTDTLGGATDVLVTHNTSVDNGSHGISLGRGADRIILVNNIVSHNNNFYSGRAIRVAAVAGDANVVQNNITWSPVESRRGVRNDGGSTVNGNLDLDPLFVAAFTDLRVQAGSPAVGLGLPEFVQSPDYAGTVRTDGAPDAGAFEQ